MTKPKGYDLFLSRSKEIKASAVETYMRSSGWVRKVEAPAYKGDEDEDAERQPAKAERKSKATNRQKSWVPWPKA